MQSKKLAGLSENQSGASIAEATLAASKRLSATCIAEATLAVDAKQAIVSNSQPPDGLNALPKQASKS